ncbi:hypothetical protein [Azospirillum picis]|uniref:Secreted protein n=1 Tax=Azospirillum picis TaxID=488438 RepID=A0ABU0MM19_9PROT|nr:hypothetical protein [Azospirillum picis]MBP2303569.1 hypothetical protein [Azospirillum picis]MDQ0534441.1 hypothetical protein [Azospirillum picis]
MFFFTLSMQATMYCVLTWVRTYENGLVLAQSLSGLPDASTSRRRPMHAATNILLFPGSRSTPHAVGGPATVIPIDRR